jgi:integrase
MELSMKYAEKRFHVWYAALTVPADVQHIIGKSRFFQSTQTGSSTEAAPRVALLVALWKEQIAKARGSLPDPKATFWEGLRTDLIGAKEQANYAAESAIFDLAEEAAKRLPDAEEGSRLFKFATDQVGTLLAPLVIAWKGSLRMAQKTIDQQHRDVSAMADHFVSLEALTPQGVKAWTDKLMREGVTASSFERRGNGCRSFWLYLQQSGTKAMIDPDPFAGAFRLAQRTAVSNTTQRIGFTAVQLGEVYAEAVNIEDGPLADLIALGAYTGARIEELCSLTKETASSGFFHFGTKTPASKRDCPIHPAVAPLVARLIKQSKDGYLIQSNAENQYGNRSGPLSQRFGHLKTAMGFGPEHVFHSIRHTLVTLMEQAGVNKSVIADVVGHEKGDFTLDTYGDGSSMKQKLKAMSKVKYPAPLNAP